VRDAALSPGGYILLDPTDEASRDLMPAYLSNRSYLVARPEGDSLRVTPSPPASGNAVVISGDGTLERDGSLLLESHVAFGGINDNAYRRALLGRRPERRRKLFEQIMKGVASGAELLRADIFPEDLQDTSRPLEVRLLVRFPETLLKGDRSMTMSPPLLSRAFGAANWLLEGSTSLERRRFPLVVSSTAMVEERLRIALGDAVGEALSLPDDSSTEGAYSFSRTFRVEDGSLSVNRSLSVNSVEFPPEDYQDLREAIKRVEADERRPPVFARNGLADANVRYLLDREEWWLSGPDSWTVTNTVWKQVLTYEGKKRHSEFKLAYNPLWKRVELLEASVSNGADRVSFAGARETNEFECSWAASAPRYPASRELVVNLPSVEIGSVIRLKYAVTVTNAPSAFRRTWYFDTTVPADEKVVVFNGAERAAKPPRRVPDEPMQPDGALWRDAVTVNSNSFARAAAVLRLAADAPKAAFPDPDVKNPSLKDVRDWMAKNVRVVGPSLYELPVGAQLTAPAVVLKERYASRLDYVRTMCALLRGAGFDADIVFAWNDADEPEAVRRRYMHEDPAPALFSTSLVRVRTREGGFLWWGGRRREVFVGTENEYSPIGATAYDGADFLDPGTGRFAKVRAAEEGLADRTAGEMRIFVRENGAVDVDVEQELFGPSVGAFRRRYAEMLPEDRSRHHQAILGEIAQAASATSDLVTDVESYPARLAFNAYIPNFATISGDTMSITVPEFGERLFGFAGNVRETPMAVASAERETSTVSVAFPPGYAEIEHLPEPYAVRNPMDGSEMWYEFAVETSDEGGRITVRLRRERSRRSECHLEPCYFALLKDWDRIGAGKANRTIVVRKTLKYPIARSGEK
ncbi:MAG: DUF3857 domain-containing protein, partial [Kiritimatiellae bacterium]|nr:DUF3857 domain-containing protein [Kiritimatiellia bacterium]